MRVEYFLVFYNEHENEVLSFSSIYPYQYLIHDTYYYFNVGLWNHELFLDI